MRLSFSKGSFFLKATSILTAALFISSGIFIPSSYADPVGLTQNETQQFVPVVTLDQANAQDETNQDAVPSGVAIPNENPLSSPTPILEKAEESIPPNSEPPAEWRLTQDIPERAPAPPLSPALPKVVQIPNPTNGFQMRFTSEADAIYGIQISSDLVNWTTRAVIQAASEETPWTDLYTAGVGMRFYRLRVADAGMLGMVMDPATKHVTNTPSFTVHYTFEGVAKTQTFSGLVEGPNLIKVMETDLAKKQTIIYWNVTLDTVAPSVVVTSPIPALTNQPSLTVSYVVDGTAKETIFTLAEGDNTSLTITETDLAGNIRTVTLPKVTLDSFAPTVNVLSGGLVNSASYTLRYEVVDNYDAARTVTEAVTLAVGNNTITRNVTDAAGNPRTLSTIVSYVPVSSLWDTYTSTFVPYDWVTTSTATGVTGDDSSKSLTLPFSFRFFDQTYTQVQVSSNGFVQFGAACSGCAYAQGSIPGTLIPNAIAAPLWRDLNPSKGGTITYSSSSTQFVVTWDNVYNYNTTTPQRFQLILNSDGTMVFQYASVTSVLSTSVGIENSMGSKGVSYTGLPRNLTAIKFTVFTPWSLNQGALYTNSREVTLKNQGGAFTSMRFSTDGGVTWSAWESLAATKTLTLPDSDGIREVQSQLKDGTGNTSTYYNSIVLDRVLPAGAVLINGGSDSTGAASVILSLTGADAATGPDQMRFSTDDGNTWTEWESFAVTKSLTLPDFDGTKEVRYQLRDRAGNTAVFSDTILLDHLIPTGSVLVNAGSSYVNDPSIMLTLSVMNALRMRFSVDGGANWTDWEDFSPLKSLMLAGADGGKTIQSQFEGAGGRLVAMTNTIILDRTAPSGTVTLNSGNAYVNTLTLPLTLSLTDAGSGLDQMRFSVDGGGTWGGWENFAPSKSLALPEPDGAKNLMSQVRDKAGNLSVFSGVITLDRSAPVGSVTINGDASCTTSTSVTLNLTASDSVSGIDQMQFSTNGGSTWSGWESFATAKSLTLPSTDGTREVRCQLRDKAGNVAISTDTIILDRVAPTGQFVLNNYSSWTNSRDVNVQITASDSASGVGQVRFSVDDGISWSSWETYGLVSPQYRTVTLPPGDGTKVVSVQVRDNAGNTVTLSKAGTGYGIVLDTVAPTGSLKINNGMTRTALRTVVLDIEAIDLTTSVRNMSFSTDGGGTWSDWELNSSRRIFSLPMGDGEKEIRVRLMDSAGNVSSLVISAAITLDSTMPVISLPDQTLSTLQAVRKAIVLGPRTAPNGDLITYSFVAPAVLVQYGQFSLMDNQLTYIPSDRFNGSGVIAVESYGGGSMTRQSINLQVNQASIVAPNDPSIGSQYGLSNTDAFRAWHLSSGMGVGVAIIDTGINMTHVDLSGSIFTNAGEIAGDGIDNDGNGFVDDVHGWDFYNSDNNPTDDNGHGTHVGGIVAAQKNNGQGGSGIAPDAKLIPIKVLDSNAGGSTIDYAFQKVAQGIQYAVQMGAKVINMSLGYLTLGISATIVQAIQNAINAAHAAGVVVVAATGNHASNVAYYTPAAMDNVIAVSATDSIDYRAYYNYSYFSNYGNQVDFSAPGANIYSTYWTSTNPSTYEYEYGTSMAAPFVAGLAAMLMAQDPTATPDDVYRRLKFSSKDIGDAGWDQYFGWGRIDAFKALSYDYYDSGVIKTQWLETPDESGWNKLFFDVNGYLTGGTYVAPRAASSLPKGLSERTAGTPERNVTQYVPAVKKQPAISPGYNWILGNRTLPAKSEKKDGSSHSEVLLPAAPGKLDPVRGEASKNRLNQLRKDQASVKADASAQSSPEDQTPSKGILKNILGSPLAETGFWLFAGSSLKETSDRG